MKKRIITKLMYLTLFVVGISILIPSCKQDDAISTTPALNVFGPSPALRGGELKFIGSNLNQVKSVILPNNIEITDIKQSTNGNEISITIPQNAQSGFITLKTDQGDITTKTKLTYLEPIKIDTITPARVKAGDVMTISGDYLNLIAQVIFTDGVVVDSSKFVSKSRKEIKVKVPFEAQSGKISISNGAEIPAVLYSNSPIAVTLPTITTIAPNPVKPGTVLKITGADFDLVKSLVFANGTDAGLTVTEFTVNSAKTEITATVPATVKEGKLKIVAKSNVQLVTVAPLTLVSPTVSSTSPIPVKNGNNITIKGTDLDLVTGVVFAGDAAGTILTQSATSIEVTTPMNAADGAAVLNLNSGKTVSTASISFIKPTLTSLAPLSLTAGDKVTITGTNLDLVRKVNFGGNQSVNITPTSATSFDVNVPMTAVTGAVTLVTSNGAQVTSTDILTVAAANKPVITTINSSVKPGELLTITGTKLHLVESIIFENNIKATQYGSRTSTTIEVYVPETAKKGSVTLTLNAYDGSQVVSPTFIISGTDPVVDASYVYFDFDSKGSWWGDKGGNENLSAYTLDGSNYFRINDNMNPWWTGLFWRNGKNGLKLDGVTVSGWVVKLDVYPIETSTGDFKLRLKGADGDFWAPIHGFAAKGGWYTVTVPLTDFSASDGSKIPTMANMDSDFGMAYGGPGEHVNMCIDNIRFEKISSSNAPKLHSIRVR